MVSSSLRKKIILWKDSATVLPVKWIQPENLHVTIIPPWYEESSKVIKILTTNPLSIPSFSLHFTDIGPGPTSHNPRLLWTTAEAAPELVDIRSFFQKLLPVSLEKRPFVPHVTIGKLFTPIHAPTIIPPFHLTFSHIERISRVFLVESFLHPKGAIYNPLLTIPLL